MENQKDEKYYTPEEVGRVILSEGSKTGTKRNEWT